MRLNLALNWQGVRASVQARPFFIQLEQKFELGYFQLRLDLKTKIWNSYDQVGLAYVLIVVVVAPGQKVILWGSEL